MTLLSFLPAWMEILVNVIGYAGFIAIATWSSDARAEYVAGFPCGYLDGRELSRRPECSWPCKPPRVAPAWS